MHPTAVAVRLTKAMEAIRADIATIQADIAAIKTQIGLSSGPANDIDGPAAPLPPARLLGDAMTRKPR